MTKPAMNPDKYTLSDTLLDVGDGHKIYVHDWGNSQAMPVIFLHGGPGVGCSDRHKARFDPEKQRVIFIDQRGSGQSTPPGKTANNTTDHLVDDINRVADHLKLKKFTLTGTSWGACLALVFAIRHPERVQALVIGGVYTGTKTETDYIVSGGFRNHFPDVWDAFVARTPDKHKSNPGEYHLNQAFEANGEAAKKSVYAFSELEGSLLSLDDRRTPQDYEEFDPEAMRIELHYLKNDCFLPDDYIINHADKLNVPVWIVQGRYDMVCPPLTAYELNKRLPKSTLIWTVAGHGNDRANYDVIRTMLLQITDGAA